MRLKIQNNVFLKEKHLLLELAAPLSFKSARPGQFLHIRIEDSCDPLLRRPLSIHDVFENSRKRTMSVRLLYEIVGKGTELLSLKKPFTEIDVCGPLGNGFDMDSIAGHKKIFIVAGGMGVAPLFFLAKKLVHGLQSTVHRKIVVLLGAKTKDQLICEKEFKDLGCDVEIATDDGSKGFKGKVTELLESLLPSTEDCRLSTIYACGPKPMLAVIAEIARRYSISAQVSLEEFMGCGLGACLGCVVRTTSGYKRICHDGPVFCAQDIIWKE